MKILLFIILLAPSFSYASSVFKCEANGVTTFSQTACDDQYKKVDIYNNSGSTTDESTAQNVIEQCVGVIKANSNFKDPQSIRIESNFTKWESDTSGARRILMVEIAAKNGYGAYDGSKHYPCYLSQDGNRLSNVQYLVQ